MVTGIDTRRFILVQNKYRIHDAIHISEKKSFGLSSSNIPSRCLYIQFYPVSVNRDSVRLKRMDVAIFCKHFINIYMATRQSKKCPWLSTILMYESEFPNIFLAATSICFSGLRSSRQSNNFDIDIFPTPKCMYKVFNILMPIKKKIQSPGIYCLRVYTFGIFEIHKQCKFCFPQLYYFFFEGDSGLRCQLPLYHLGAFIHTVGNLAFCCFTFYLTPNIPDR